MKEAPSLPAAKRRVLILVAIAGVLAYMGVALAVDSKRLGAALVQLGLQGCGIVLALSLLNYVLRFQRWQSYVTIFGHRVPMLRHLLCYLSGFAFTASPAKAGEAVRAIYLREYGVTYAESIAALFVERLLDLIAIVLLASLIVADHASYRPLIIGVLGTALFMLIVASRPGLPQWLNAYADKHTGKLAKLLQGGASLLRSSGSLLRPQVLTMGTIIGVIAWGAEGLGFYFICHGLDVQVSAPAAVGIYSIAALAGSAAFFLPGGIGGMEIVMTTLLVDAGATLKVAVIATLLCRLATLWFAVIIGVGAASALEIRPSKGRARATS